MDPGKYYDITHRDHILCNPLSSAKVDEILGLLDLAPGAAPDHLAAYAVLIRLSAGNS